MYYFLQLHPKSRNAFLTHGIVAILAFGFFGPCSIYIAKYGRECFGGTFKNFCKLPIWLLVKQHDYSA